MSPGAVARRLLGPAFKPFGWLYRRAFVDMARVVAELVRQLPPSARVLDVGGGDGFVADLLLDARPDISITMVDIAPAIGGFIHASRRERVALRPGTELKDVSGAFDAILLTDVLHHVPIAARTGFLAELRATADRVGCDLMLIKDIEPRGLRAKLALWGDLYVTGDRNVVPAPARTVTVPGFGAGDVLMPHFPNYCLVLRRDVAGTSVARAA